MYRKIASLLLTLITSVALYAQSPVNNIIAQVPSASNLTLSQVGAQGTNTYYYWVVTVYAGGKSAPYGPVVTTSSNGTLSSTNYNVVSFTAPTSPLSAPTGYDILRTTTPTAPTGACACAVATAQSGSPVNDQSNTLSAYTVSTVTSNSYSLLDVITSTTPTLKTFIGGTLASSVDTTGSSSATNATYTVTRSGITDAQLATGVVLVSPVSTRTVRVVHAEIQPIGGNAATCTDIRIESDTFANEVLKFLVSGTLVASTWYDEASPVAQVTSVGNAVTPFGTQFAAGVGIGIQSTGSTCATMTSLNVVVQYTYN